MYLSKVNKICQLVKNLADNPESKSLYNNTMDNVNVILDEIDDIDIKNNLYTLFLSLYNYKVHMVKTNNMRTEIINDLEKEIIEMLNKYRLIQIQYIANSITKVDITNPNKVDTMCAFGSYVSTINLLMKDIENNKI